MNGQSQLADVLAVACAIGGVFLGISPVLQIREMVRRRSSEGVALGYWGILAAGMSLWLAYGITIGNAAMIVANGVSVTVALVVLVVGLRFKPASAPLDHVITDSTQGRESLDPAA